MFYCEKCGSTDCCERTDLVNEPVLCDGCYKTIYIYVAKKEKTKNKTKREQIVFR